MKKLNRSKEKQKDLNIRDVYADNFQDEIRSLSLLLQKYNYVSMDTEFPGVVFQSSSSTKEAYYRTIKMNVDKLKLIQVGITISDERGNYPEEVCTWQFNLKFDLNSDQYSNESIALLTNSGINFECLQNRGIPHEVFGEYLMTSGLVLNEEIQWISFHGIYDFAYFLRIVTNLPLPESESTFFDCLKLYFNNYYDIRFLVRYNDSLRGSLAKLGQELNISRVGTQHQAGSDSLITAEIFFKLIRDYLSEEVWKNDKNILYGIGLGSEDSDNYSGQYTYPTYKFNSGSNNFYDFNYYQQQNILQYNYMRNRELYMNTMNSMSLGQQGMSNISTMLNPNSYFPYSGYNMNMWNNRENNPEDPKKKYKGILED
jgi:CCR4-NOT transcription complex subunit 7/8